MVAGGRLRPAVVRASRQSVSLSTTETPAARTVGVEQVRQVWSSDVAPSLKPLVRALYAAGSFTGDVTSDGRFVYELPNEHHVNKCEQHRTTVESTLAI